MMKALLLCASHNDLGLIKALRKLGYYIIVTGKIPGLIGERFADKYIQADYSDKDLILEIARSEGIDVICPCCNDFGVYTAAYVAEKLNILGYDSYETTLTLNNKDKFKEFAKQHNIITPQAVSFESKDEAQKQLEQMDFPLIIKPTDASAGNGIHRVDSLQEGIWAIEEAFAKSRAGRIVIEPYIEGTQHGFCTFLINQKVVACCSNNEYSIINPYRVEIDTYPADNYEEVKDTLVQQIEKIADILSLKDGIFHLQYIMSNGQPQIIEVMRRVLGNMYSVPANMLNNMNWDYWEVRARCGLDCSDFPVAVSQEGYFAYKTILAPDNGIIERIEIPEKYNKFLLKYIILCEEGHEVTHYQTEPIGFLFFSFSSQNEMKHVLIEDYVNDIVKMR